MTVTKWHRTNNFTIPDPMDDDTHKPNTREKQARIKHERKTLDQMPDTISYKLQLFLDPKDNTKEYIIKATEKDMLANLMKKCDKNIEAVANCMNTTRRCVYGKLREYGLEE